MSGPTSWELRRLGDVVSDVAGDVTGDVAGDAGAASTAGAAAEAVAHCGSTHMFVLCSPGSYEFVLRDTRGRAQRPPPPAACLSLRFVAVQPPSHICSFAPRLNVPDMDHVCSRKLVNGSISLISTVS